MGSITSKKGDGGYSQTLHGEMLPKDHLLFESLGALDELNAHLGSLRVLLKKGIFGKYKTLSLYLLKIQNGIIELSGQVSNHPFRHEVFPIPFDIEMIQDKMDDWIIALEQKNIILKKFIIPGKNAKETEAHFCRCLSRRCERVLVQLMLRHERGDLKAWQIILNIHSAFLFLIAVDF
ncbi:MAG: ATP:cob(I)alamin adenosyltransferase [Spirochaetaceae bacterium]|nr:ATP:cob(I)alamin adenosyltransferase [Spirochaetaceae bacterium]